jgi:hypothetical protein
MKSKLQHTPGPWNEEGIYTILRYADKHDMDIDESEKIMPWSTDDARLIAAAPEMLEELINFCRYNCSGCPGMTKGCSGTCGSNVKTLLEKITGLTIKEVLSE